MSRLHIIAASVSDIATHFGVAPVPMLDVPTGTTEGAGGLAVFERNGCHLLKAMDWGFPRLTRVMREQGDPPGRIGLVADLTNPLWADLVVDPRYRCLIPISHFANPDGTPSEKTRTWYSVKKQPIIAWAGFCCNVPDYEPVYTGMTMEANAAVAPTNDRMPAARPARL